MNDRIEPAFYILVGVLVVAGAVLVFSPLSDRTMVSSVVEEGPPQSEAQVTPYTELSRPVREAVDEVLRTEWTTFSTHDDYAALESLPRTLSIEKNGEVYQIRTTSADGSGGLFEGIAHDTLLAVGGLLIGAALYVSDRKRRVPTALVFPVASTGVVLGTNASLAPDLSVVDRIAQSSFGLAVAVPVLIGIAARRRDRHIGGLAVVISLLSIGVLLPGDAASPLATVLGTALVALPGLALGWRIGSESRFSTTAV